MTTVTVSSITPDHTSLAVAVGQAVIAALRSTDRVMIDDDASDISEIGMNEMTQYLARRGVTVRYDHDLGSPVAAN